MSDLLKEKSENLPETPGVYLFKNKKNQVIYVGKAKNLHSRVSSYFGINLASKTLNMINDAADLSVIKVGSEIEALLLEAKLVRTKLPKYNIQLKDDKSPLYIAITRDKYPRILSVRKTQMQQMNIKVSFGPFLESQSVKKVLRLLRKIIPYSQHLPTQRVCIYKQIGLCDPCPSEIENEENKQNQIFLRKKYLQNIKNIKKFLSGGLTSVKKNLVKQMNEYSKKEMFEEAQKLSNQIRILDYITTPKTHIDLYLKDPNLIEDIRSQELYSLRSILTKYFDIDRLERIECFDVAHLAGTKPTASMVTFIEGEPDKKFYRHFKVNTKKRQSDTDSMKSILIRRAGHFSDWGKPDLIIVDGGKPQVSIAKDALSEYKIPVIGLAKRFETIVIKYNDKFLEIRPKGASLNLLERIRDEAHRFARRLHHRQITKSLIGI